jgi:hypothetical protein
LPFPATPVTSEFTGARHLGDPCLAKIARAVVFDYFSEMQHAKLFCRFKALTHINGEN